MKTGNNLALHLDPDRYPRHLEEQFPRIFGKVALLWGTLELENYLQELILDYRGNRSGFPSEVMRELTHIQEAAHRYRMNLLGMRVKDPRDI